MSKGWTTRLPVTAAYPRLQRSFVSNAGYRLRRGVTFLRLPLNLEGIACRVARFFIEERVDCIVPSKAFDLDLEPEIVGAVGIDQGLLE